MPERPQTHTSLVITVDTEPDDQWAPPGQDGLLPPFSFANTRGLDRLADFLHELGVPVTWMTSYGVARDAESARVLRRQMALGDEIAGHLHGWEAPPYSDVDRRHKPFIYEYEPEVRLAKHKTLWQALIDAFDEPPVSYRAGRWGLDTLEHQHLAQLGYRIDSSVPPGIDFRDRAGRRALGPDFRPYLVARGARPFISTRHEGPALWQVPASVVLMGGLGDGSVASTLGRWAANRQRPRSVQRVASRLLDSTALSRLVWVRPLKHPRDRLAAATRALVRRGAPVINVMFHSSEAFLGTSPWSRDRDGVERLYGDLAAIVETALAEGAVPRTLRDAAATWTPTPVKDNPLDDVQETPR